MQLIFRSIGGKYMLLRTIIWFAYFWLYLLLTLPVSGYITYLEKKNPQKASKFVAHFVKNWARRLIKLAGGEITIIGEENLPRDTAYMVAANHQGYFDIPIMLSMVGDVRGFVAKKELEHLICVRLWMRHLHCLFVDRGSPRAGAQTIINGSKMLKEGHSLTIFPEGTRSKGGPVKPFKAGAFRIAAQVGKPVVPVTIDGSYKLLEANPHSFINAAKVKVTIHKPIETKNMTREQAHTLPEQVRQVIINDLNK